MNRGDGGSKRTHVEMNSLNGGHFSVRRLTLRDFRNYQSLRVELLPGISVLIGANGAGKTNLLEAVSMLAPGRGLRRAKLGDMSRQTVANNVPSRGWAVAARVDTPAGVRDIGTGFCGVDGENVSGGRRTVRIDGETMRGQAALSSAINVHWLTPQMDQLFQEGSSARRRFLDRMVFGWDPAHAGRVLSYERAMRERMKLLRSSHQPDVAWLSALEETMVSKGIAVTAARIDVVGRIASAAVDGWGPFPGARVSLDGDLENWLMDGPALKAEENFRATLVTARREDARIGRTSAGPHRTDLLVQHRPKGQDAARCSTGEQKALLIGLVLADARTRAAESGCQPILLMDEVAAHLDEARRAALFEALEVASGQVWLTGTDRALFAPLEDRANFFTVKDEIIVPDCDN